MYARCLCRLTCKTLKTPYIQILFVRGTSQIKINFGSWIVFLKFILTYYNVIVKVLPRNGQRSGCEQPGPFRFPAQQGSLPQGGDGILTELKKNKNIWSIFWEITYFKVIKIRRLENGWKLTSCHPGFLRVQFLGFHEWVFQGFCCHQWLVSYLVFQLVGLWFLCRTIVGKNIQKI